MTITTGVYPDMSHRDYHEASEWVSSSELKRHLPEHYKPFTGSPAADIGSVLHARFTGDTTPVTVVDAATWTGKAAKETRAAVVASGGYAILAGDAPTIDGMEAALRSHPVASRLLLEDGAWEVSVFSEPDGVPSRARFDRLLNSGVAVDLKTTKSQRPGPYELTRAVIDYGYDVQKSHYQAVAEAAGIDVHTFAFVFVQSTAPHYVTVAYLDEGFLERGAQLRDLALRRYLHPQMEDTYPGEREPVTLTCPRWAEL